MESNEHFNFIKKNQPAATQILFLSYMYNVKSQDNRWR